jgi:methylmalonyl-CoA mutase C-terminal domain/subunit
MTQKIRVLMAKPGLDMHDRGLRFISAGLVEAGMEVIYTGLLQAPENIVKTAIQEDVDVIGLSILSGSHNTIFPKIMGLIKKNNLDILVIAGGVIPDEDVPELKRLGIAEVFGPGTHRDAVVAFIKKNIRISVR